MCLTLPSTSFKLNRCESGSGASATAAVTPASFSMAHRPWVRLLLPTAPLLNLMTLMQCARCMAHLKCGPHGESDSAKSRVSSSDSFNFLSVYSRVYFGPVLL